VEQAFNAPPSAYDSHPSPETRFSYVRAIGGPAMDEDPRTAWSLLEGREALEREMTDEIRLAVEVNHGVAIAREPTAAAPGPDDITAAG
jgi:hypothetical protein